LREDGWEMLADGVRTGDKDKIARATERSQKADRLAGNIGK
jgi:hypothetical protein